MSVGEKKEIRKCPCWFSKWCEAYQRLYPIDPLCVYHYEADPERDAFARRFIEAMEED